MLPKPSSCQGCPFYGTGQGFVPDELRPGTEVMVLGQNPGAQEEKDGKPFVGLTGQMMESKFLPLAGLDRSRISIGNAIRCRVNSANELPPLDQSECRAAVEHCTRAHLRVPEGARLVVAQGAYALYALTGHGANKNDRISDWRGWALALRPLDRTRTVSASIYQPSPAEITVLATLHLAAIFRDATLQHPTKHDWSRAAKLLAGKWPEPMPRIRFEPPLPGPHKYALPHLFALDTEFVPETRRLIRYSLAWRLRDGEPVVHVVDGSDPSQIVSLSARPRVIFHHTGADQDYADQLMPDGYDIEDTMHGHAVLWSDLDHDLGFLGSIYGRLNRWKHLDESSPLIYSGADALVTYDAWCDWIAPQFERDKQSEWVYRNLQLPLIGVIRRAGNLRVNQAVARQALAALEAKCEDAEARAQAAVGWPMNLGSGPQVVKQLYEIERVHAQAKKGYRK